MSGYRRVVNSGTLRAPSDSAPTPSGSAPTPSGPPTPYARTLRPYSPVVPGVTPSCLRIARGKASNVHAAAGEIADATGTLTSRGSRGEACPYDPDAKNDQATSVLNAAG
ncbi:hypothetical protein [Streptomyces sp. TRM49041]|uniref:hypothetical protein n=1 Tax=Streptomyces sp. TRM49041 TaxID=2603216 RepID=UPI0011EED7E2|nr:hypothetical protein [Streptomyces sp. TRM49041]